jgi:hypothetical protein
MWIKMALGRSVHKGQCTKTRLWTRLTVVQRQLGLAPASSTAINLVQQQAAASRGRPANDCADKIQSCREQEDLSNAAQVWEINKQCNAPAVFL